MQDKPCQLETRAALGFLLLVAILMPAFKLAIVDRVATPFRHPKLRDDGTLPGVEHLLNQPYADGLMLIGFDQSATEMPADGILRVDLHWTVRHQPSHRYQTVIHLVGLEGIRWSHPDSYRPMDYQNAPPTTTWVPGRHALDSHEVELLPGTPPGVYDVVLTVFDRESLAPISVLDEALQPTAPDLTLGQVKLVAPRSVVQPQELDVRERLDVSLGPLTLLGVNFDRERAAPGDPLFATMFWHADAKPAEELVLRLELLAPDDSVAGAYDLPPTAPWHPVATWQAGDIWRGQHVLHLPAELHSASYTWTLSLVSPDRQTVSLASLLVTAPERSFTPPPMDLSADARLGGVATLVGASLAPDPAVVVPGTTLTVTLVWRAEAETDASYRVFVHLVDPDGNLVAQSDGVPAAWTRPTTSWLPGEYVTDEHSLAIPLEVPTGQFELVAGMYLHPTGDRLTTPDGRGAIPLTTLRSADDGQAD